MNKMVVNIDVQWFCRTCWHRGYTGVTILPVENKIATPTKEDILRIVEISCHLDALHSKDLRIFYDEEKLERQITKAN